MRIPRVSAGSNHASMPVRQLRLRDPRVAPSSTTLQQRVTSLKTPDPDGREPVSQWSWGGRDLPKASCLSLSSNQRNYGQELSNAHLTHSSSSQCRVQGSGHLGSWLFGQDPPSNRPAVTSICERLAEPTYRVQKAPNLQVRGRASRGAFSQAVVKWGNGFQ